MVDEVEAQPSALEGWDVVDDALPRTLKARVSETTMATMVFSQPREPAGLVTSF